MTTREKIENTIKKYIVDEFFDDERTQKGWNEKLKNPDTKLKEDLGLDSLDGVQLIMHIEDIFRISIPDDEINYSSTLKELFDYVENLTNL
jgi:acyl carrier protein